MNRFRFGATLRLVLVASMLLLGPAQGVAAAQTAAEPAAGLDAASLEALRQRNDEVMTSRISQDQREAAALRTKLMQQVAQISAGRVSAAAVQPAPNPGGIPDYFGTPDPVTGRPVANWAYSPLLRKFVDTLPGVGVAAANNLGSYIGVAHPDTTTYPGSDYYEIELREYEQQLHSDMPPTRLRGYVQTNTGTGGLAPDPISYLGPFIFATEDRPVRVKFTNKLPVGEGGDLFIPVDTSVMGAGMGPDGMTEYTQNRATLHLHGGISPWISDGTPHQWITPAGETTEYPKGVSVKNVPDMPDPGDGSMTFFYTNQQSARLMWVHDHSYGITRLNVYAGEVMPYAITDDIEKDLITRGIIPDAASTIPLIVQDKTFVDEATIGVTDPTWNWGSTPPYPHTGDLWMPHVYVPAQNPADPGGMNATGRWHYGPWFWPPTTDILYGPTTNPYFIDEATTPWENPTMPATPNPSMGMEAFHDTPLVNGVAYPTVTVSPKPYRLRILNGASDRFFNLQMYTADPTVVTADGRTNTEVKMVPAVPTPAYDVAYPSIAWPTDGRDGGAPDPATAGPEWVQIGNESGFLPTPAVIPQQPITWNRDPTTFNMGNVQDHSLLVAPAERADVIVDFSAYAGQTIILYNDAPTAFPALDARTDYYTGAPDMTDTGGTYSPQAGYGPNTRTVMQIKVAAAAPAPAYNRTALMNEFVSTGPNTSVFQRGQNPIIVPDARYNAVYSGTFPANPYVHIYENLNKTFSFLDGTSMLLPLEPKALQDEMGETFDKLYGRMSGNFGLQIPGVGGALQNFVLYGYIDPPTENLTDQMTPLAPVQVDGTQIWRITHNGVDTHPIHFHLFDVQVINRVGWDGAIRPPDDNELGWKETLRVSPLEDTIVALKPVAPKLPFAVPDSVRPLDPTMPLGTTGQFSPFNALGEPRTVTNINYNFGWEYVFHCHILSHEEMDMMRPVTLAVGRDIPNPPNPFAATGVSGGLAGVALTWVDATPARPNLTVVSSFETTSEVGFRVERADLSSGGVPGMFEPIFVAPANSQSYTDLTTIPGRAYRYRVVAFNASADASLLGASSEVDIFPAADAYFDSFVTTPTAGPNGSITPATPRSVPVGAPSDIPFTFAPDPGYHIADVLLDGVSVGTPSSYTILAANAGNHKIHVDFAINQYAITPTAGPNGRIWWTNTQNPAPGDPVPPVQQAIPLVQHGVEMLTFAFVADPGYQVAEVRVNNVVVPRPVYGGKTWDFYTFANVTNRQSISVTFELQTFTITPTAGAGGTITPATPQTVTAGSSAAFTIAANPGYHLTELRVDGALVPTTNTYTFTNVQINHTIAATFTSDQMLPVYRFFNLRNGSHFYTASLTERDHVNATWPTVYSYEGVAYSVNLDNPVNVQPLHRFYNSLTGSHFYTASEVERAMVQATWPTIFAYEGPAYNVAVGPGVNTLPVYRFYNVRSQSHFYTISEVERANVIATWPNVFTNEGVGFYIGY